MVSLNRSLQRIAPATRLGRIWQLGWLGLLTGMWFWLYRPLFSYFAIIFSREDFRTNQLVLVGVLLLIASRLRKGQGRWPVMAAPQLRILPLSLAMGGALLYLLAERFLNINTLSASLFGLATYGLMGLWLAPQRWRQGMPAVLLLIGSLPFGEHLQTFVGYPMRLMTAAIVRDGLAASGVATLGIDTILILENGVSQVDLPCSGVKSLWTGLLFLIAATWIERRRLNWRWLMTALMFAGLLFVVNLARVGVLVLVGEVAGWRLAAEMLHVPMGVLGFVAACAAAVYLLRAQPALQKKLSSDYLPASRPLWLAPLLAMATLVMALLYSPRPQTGLAQPPPDWTFPAGLKTEPLPLRADELEWLTRDGAESADRHRFEWQGIRGSMILITSQTWRAHHRPERCFEVYGLSLEASQALLVAPDFPLRFVSLGDGQGNSQLSASYWFQSAQQTTDDYASRMWADLSPERQRWVLVSILFDDLQDPNTAEVQAFYAALRETVAHSLAGSSS